MPISEYLQICERENTLRIDWDYRRVPKDTWLFILVVFSWLVWFPLTLYGTAFFCMSIAEGEFGPFLFLIVWVLLGWLGVLMIPYGVLGRWSSEWIEISPLAITHGQRSVVWWPKPRTYRFDTGVQLLFGYHQSDESFAMLHLFVEGEWFTYRIVGYWLTLKLKEELFLTIEAYVRAHELPVVVKRNDRGGTSH